MKPIEIRTPIPENIRKSLKAGDEVLLSGTLLTCRDEAHRRLSDMAKRGRHIPIALKDAVIYYCGPTPPPPRRVIGSCGPTTSSRMDAFTPQLLGLGVKGMIGKGRRGDEVRKAIKKHRAVYFLATGGIGALLATKVKKAKPVLFRELGPEAIYKLDVRDFPLIVGIDSKGRDIYS
jgi:fumarate hydratase subunit beta